jgi:excisionase family DNA binding protein
MIETLVTEKELCEWLKVSRATVGKMRRRDLPHYQIGSLVRYSKEEVQKWLERHQHVLEEEEGDIQSEENVNDEEDHEGQDDVNGTPGDDMEFVWEEKGCRE